MTIYDRSDRLITESPSSQAALELEPQQPTRRQTVRNRRCRAWAGIKGTIVFASLELMFVYDIVHSYSACNYSSATIGRVFTIGLYATRLR